MGQHLVTVLDRLGIPRLVVEQDIGSVTLIRLGYRASEAQGYTNTVRRSRYDLSASTNAEQLALEQMLAEEKQSEPINDP